MNLPNVLKKPLVAALLGAAAIAAPVSVLYVAGATRAAATTASSTQPTPAAPSANPAAQLPDFSAMVQRYGPAVVNIAVTSKSIAAMEQGDEDDNDDNDNG